MPLLNILWYVEGMYALVIFARELTPGDRNPSMALHTQYLPVN